jgi:O-antigen ligase/polysaccharide polymerase Wzy-like membrane protein
MGVRPSLGTRVLFFLLLAGPPKFRLRDPSASLDSTIDWVIVLQIIVWIMAGCWVLSNHAYWSDRASHQRARSTKLEIMSAILFVLLSLSVFSSEAPTFSAFKIYQLVVTFAVITLFVRKFGIEALLNNLFFGCGILAVADIVAAFVTPSMVLVLSELGTIRFRGDLIAQTGTVSVIGLFLLLTSKSDLPKGQFAFWAVILGGVLVFSLARTSYLAVFVLVLLAALRRPPIPVLRRIVTLVLLVLPLVFGVLLSALNTQRQAEDIWTLSDRVGLWSYLIDVTVQHGPWLGLGYFAASRIYAPEYNPALGTAHSAFMEIYAGGGLISLAVFLGIWVVVAVQITRLYLGRPDRMGFALVALFCAALFLNAIGGELQAEPAGFCFWCVVASLPVLSCERSGQAIIPASSAVIYGESC